MGRNLRVGVYRTIAFAKRISLRRRGGRISAAAPGFAQRSVFTAANARGCFSHSRRLTTTGTHRAVRRLRCGWRDVAGIACGNVARIRWCSRIVFAGPHGGGLRFKPRKRRTLSRTTSASTADCYRLRDLVTKRDRRSAQTRGGRDRARSP